MNAQLNRRPGLVVFLSLLATVGGSVFLLAAEKKPASEPLPLPTEIPGDSLPPGAVMRLGSATAWQAGDLIHAVAFSHDGKRLASASFGEDSIRIWEVKSGQLLHRVPLPDVRGLALSDDGKMLAAIGRDKSGKKPGVWLWKEVSGKPPVLVAKTEKARCLIFQGNVLWVGEQESISAWELDGKLLLTYKFEKPPRVNALASSRGSQPLLAAATSNGLLVMDSRGKIVDSASTASKESATSVAISPDGESVAVGTEDGSLCAWRIENSSLVKRFESRPHRIGVTSIAFSADGKQLISVCHGGQIFRSDAATGDNISKVIAKGGPTEAAEVVTTPALVLSDDGQRLAGRFGVGRARNDPNLHVWDTTNGQELSTLPGFKGILRKLLGPSGEIQKMAFQSDGSLVSLSTMGELTHWDTKHGREIRRELIPRENVNKVAISADARVTFFDEDHELNDIDLKTGKRSPRYRINRWIYGRGLLSGAESVGHDLVWPPRFLVRQGGDRHRGRRLPEAGVQPDFLREWPTAALG